MKTEQGPPRLSQAPSCMSLQDSTQDQPWVTTAQNPVGTRYNSDMSEWLRLWLDSIRDSKWTGTGIVIRKAHRDSLQGDAIGVVGTQPAYGSTHVPERWVLVVSDSSGEELYIEVEQEIWDHYNAGDTYTEGGRPG